MANKRPLGSVDLPGRLAEKLVQDGLISQDQLTVARVSEENLGENLGNILIKKGFITERQLLEFVGKHLRVPTISLKNKHIDWDLVRALPEQLVKKHCFLPFERHGSKIRVAMSNPLDVFAGDDLKANFKEEIEVFLATPAEIQEQLEQAYKLQTRQNGKGAEVRVENLGTGETLLEESAFKKIQEIASGPKVIQAVNGLILQAWQEQASDIHVEPTSDGTRIRYRIDGLLEEKQMLSKEMHLPLVSRIKILARLDIAEHRVPQDGRVRLQLIGRSLDIRVATCPTQYGEKIVLRLLAKEAIKGIEGLGFKEQDRKIFSDLIGKPHGIFLATGPTGSGKSTTLYAALTRINSVDRNIVTIEDPIESEVEGVSQIAVNPKVGLTFATILRSVLRQDPDVIMLGEIRDAETAEIAVRAAITGHMVLSTLHTNTAAGAISRLMDLGVEPFLLASALQGVMAQRLVRRICDTCKQEIQIPDTKITRPPAVLEKAYRGRGCEACRFTGYRGRLGIFELAPITESIRRLISEKAPDHQIEKALRDLGVRSMVEDGLEKIAKGWTTVEEVLRVTEEE